MTNSSDEEICVAYLKRGQLRVLEACLEIASEHTPHQFMPYTKDIKDALYKSHEHMCPKCNGVFNRVVMLGGDIFGNNKYPHKFCTRCDRQRLKKHRRAGAIIMDYDPMKDEYYYTEMEWKIRTERDKDEEHKVQ